MSQKREKKKKEELLAREFFEHIGISSRALEMREPPCPDAEVRCLIDGRERVLGVELTEYQVDAQRNGGSKERMLDSLGRRILETAQKQCTAIDPQMEQLHVEISSNKANPPSSRDEDRIAADLAKFLSDRFAGMTESWTRFLRHRRDFEGYPELEAHMDWIHVYRCGPEVRGPLLWQYNGTAHVRMVEDVVLNILEQKARKRKAYSLPDATEYWLVICAGVSIPSDCAGPQSHCHEVLQSARIRTTGSQAGFDRIYFWDRAHDWHEVMFHG